MQTRMNPMPKTFMNRGKLLLPRHASGAALRSSLRRTSSSAPSKAKPPGDAFARALAVEEIAGRRHITRDTYGVPYTVRTPHSILPLSIVEHPYVKRMLPFIGHGAYMLLDTPAVISLGGACWACDASGAPCFFLFCILEMAP